MDVESLAKQLILKGMTEGQQKAVLDSIKGTMEQSRTLQKQRVGEQATLVIQALKKIETDITSRYDALGNKIEARVASIKDGSDGVNGVNGKDGREGRPGRDGAQGPKGTDGLPGRDGRDGVDGVSVTDAHIDFDGSLVISLSNGRVINVGEVVAPDLAEKIKVITNGGGTSQGVLDTLASLQSQINNLDGFLDYKGTWNASTNSPALVSSVGTKGDYYVVSVAGSTTLNGESSWGVGDWVVFNANTWQKVDGGSTGNLTTLTVSGASTLASVDVSGTVLTRNDTYQRQQTPISLTAGQSLTASQLLTGIFVNTAGAANWTMPTGTALDSGLLASLPNDSSIDFSVIVTGGGGPTIVGNTGVTTVGNMNIPNGVSGTFRLRKTATATYVVYRLT